MTLIAYPITFFIFDAICILCTQVILFDCEISTKNVIDLKFQR